MRPTTIRGAAQPRFDHLFVWYAERNYRRCGPTIELADGSITTVVLSADRSVTSSTSEIAPRSPSGARVLSRGDGGVGEEQGAATTPANWVMRAPAAAMAFERGQSERPASLAATRTASTYGAAPQLAGPANETRPDRLGGEVASHRDIVADTRDPVRSSPSNDDTMTGGRPLVSVVMPVRNGGSDLDEALASMLGQTFSDFEFIAVDDHSTDETPSRLRRATEDDPRVRLITSPGHGFVAAVTAGVSASGGDWIARMDADDRSHPDRLARQMAHLDAHADIDVLGTSVRVIDAGGNPAGTIRYPLDHALIALSLRAATALHHGTVIVRRAALAAAGGYRPERFPAEDYDLWCRLVIAGARLANLDEPLYDYRLSAGGVSRTVKERQQAMATRIGVEYGRLLPSVPRAREAWRAAGAIAQKVTDGEVDARALGRAARSTRESILPWVRSRRWDGASAALAGAIRAETAFRRRCLTAACGRQG